MSHRGFPFSRPKLSPPTHVAGGRWREKETRSAVAYSLVASMAFWQAGGAGSLPPYTPLVAAVACWGAAGVAPNGRARLGVMLTLAAVWFEVHAGFVVAPAFPAPGLLVAPVLVTASGLLLGQRATFLVAWSSVVGASPMYLWGLARSGATFSPGDIFWLTVHGTVTLASWGLIGISLAALPRVVHAVRHKEGELSDMIEFAPDGVVVVGADHRVRLVNPAAERLLGLSAPACVGQTIEATLLTAGGAPNTEVSEGDARGADAPRAYTFTRADQTPCYIDIAWRTIGPDRRQLVVRDVSERVRASCSIFHARMQRSPRREIVSRRHRQRHGASVRYSWPMMTTVRARLSDAFCSGPVIACIWFLMACRHCANWNQIPPHSTCW